MKQPDQLTGPQIAAHGSSKSCWIVVHEHAYDVTDFLPEHPGGAAIILKYAGRDATAEFDTVHPPDVLSKYLPETAHLGPVDMSSLAPEQAAAGDDDDPEEQDRLRRVAAMPGLAECLNLFDFEAVAKSVMKRSGWNYYSSGADDEITLRENHSAFHRVWFRPRVLRNVEHVSLKTTFLRSPTSLPLYITATALGKLGHKDGEVCLTRAARATGVVQMIPTLASCSFDEIVDAAEPGQPLWLQLYVNKDRAATRAIIEHAERRGCSGLFITVDAPSLGRREKDMRTRYTGAGSNVQQQQQQSATGGIERDQGAARAISSFIDPSLSWADLGWFSSVTRMPIVLKGLQRADEVVRAADAGLAGVVISNHGGRQLDTAPPAIQVLAEAVPELLRRGYYTRRPADGNSGGAPPGRLFEVYIDGGIRRGSDIVKALCLGATGVGIGRPFLYAMSAYGADGVTRAIGLLKDELEMNMRMVGATSLDELTPDLVDARALLAGHLGPAPVDRLSRSLYEPLSLPTIQPSAKL